MVKLIGSSPKIKIKDEILIYSSARGFQIKYKEYCPSRWGYRLVNHCLKYSKR